MGAAAKGWKKNGLIIAHFIGMGRQWEPHTAQGLQACAQGGRAEMHSGVHPYMASPHGTLQHRHTLLSGIQPEPRWAPAWLTFQ